MGRILQEGKIDMGTFAMLFQKAGAEMPDEKKEEFRARIERLFQMGGMMKWNE